MHNALVRLAAVGVIVTGFLCTGDIARLAAHGTRLINARTVPSAEATQDRAAAAEEATGTTVHAAPMQSGVADGPYDQHPPGARPQPPAADAAGHDAPLGLATEVPPPDDGGAATVDLAALQPGDRVLVWLAGPPSSLAAGHGGTTLIAYDMVDPATGEALEQRHVATRGSGRTEVVLGSPRRLVLQGSGVPGLFARGRPATVTRGRIAKGETILAMPRTGFPGGESPASPEAIGPVLAIQTTRPAAQ